ncbi:MAG: C25 family cysteine peptidase [bacterium]
MRSALLILSMIILPAIISAQDIFIKAGNRQSNTNEITLISTDNSKTVIDVKVNGFYNKKVTAVGQQFDNVSLKDFVSLGIPGQSALPTITKFISIPNHKNITININSADKQVFDSYNVLPYQTPPLRNSNGISQAFEKDDSYYSLNKDLPENIVSIKEIAVMRDHRIAVVTINPVQYNPSTGDLTVYTDINFELRYEGSSDVNNITFPSQGVSKSFRNIYKNVIFNYTPDNTFTTPPSMLIIVADSLYTNIIPYAQWKNKKGIKTQIAKRSEIAATNFPTSDEIKDYLIAQYNSSSRSEYVLLVGDARGNNSLPWFSATGGKSDHPYECLDGTDIFPEIVVGRLSVQSANELDSAVTKFIQYEKQPNMTDTEWYKRAFVLHSMDGIDPVNAAVAKSVFLNEGGFTNVDVVSPSASQSQITNYINGGVSWIWFIGHGDETSWATPVWQMSNMVNLNFGKKQPNIVSIACSNADLDYSQTANCFAEGWVERSPENSATNIAASTELCAFFTTDTLGREMLYAYFRNDINDFGSMLNYGKIQAYNYFNGNVTVVETINQFMVIGDPTIESYSDVPKTLNVVSSRSGTTYSVNIKNNGQNIHNALVAISQNNALMISGYTDAQGVYTFNESDIDPLAQIDVVVTGKNLAPYEGSMILTSIGNNIGEADSYSLSQNYPNPFNPATNIDYSIPAGVNGEGTNVSLVIYNSLGSEISTLVNGSQNPGSYSVQWDAANYPSGIYFYRLTAGDLSEVKKMTLLK